MNVIDRHEIDISVLEEHGFSTCFDNDIKMNVVKFNNYIVSLVYPGNVIIIEAMFDSDVSYRMPELTKEIKSILDCPKVKNKIRKAL